METSYFRRKGLEESRAISIAIYQPKGFHFPEAPELAPTRKMLKEGYGYKDYVSLLESRQLDPIAIHEKYADGILCCWEKEPAECHRRFVARWLEEALGVTVEEFSGEVAKV
jgi:uncharacterized protein (DUF488 family)